MPALPPERLPRIPQKHWTEEQKKVAAAIASGPRGEVRGPFLALLRSPGLAHTAFLPAHAAPACGQDTSDAGHSSSHVAQYKIGMSPTKSAAAMAASNDGAV